MFNFTTTDNKILLKSDFGVCFLLQRVLILSHKIQTKHVLLRPTLFLFDLLTLALLLMCLEKVSEFSSVFTETSLVWVA